MITLPLAAALAISAAQAAEIVEAPTSVTTSQADKTGTIIIYRRGSIGGLANACPVRYLGEEIVELGRGKVFEWRVKPGRYILENKTSSVEVSVDPSETRYVRCQIKSGILILRADLQIVDGTEYAEVKDKLEAPGS